MTAGFLERPGAVDDTFDPLAPARLAFQIRRVLTERPTSLPESVVYDEVARRRDEISAAALETFRASAPRLVQIARKSTLLRLLCSRDRPEHRQAAAFTK